MAKYTDLLKLDFSNNPLVEISPVGKTVDFPLSQNKIETVFPFQFDSNKKLSSYISAEVLLGRYDSASGIIQEILLGDNLSFDGNTLNAATGGGGGGSGTVTTISVASANGFAGSVATATTTPVITLTTSITGLLKGNGTTISAATAGTDYLTPSGNGSTLTGLTKTQVGLSNVDNTSDLSKPISTLTQTALDGKANSSHTHTASNITDFDTEVSNNTDVAANTAARHAALTLGGTATYLSMTGQAITRWHIELNNSNHVTGNLNAGTNLTGTKANFNTACSDGNFVYVGDNISGLTNDSGFITASSANALTNKTGNISQWTNDSGYLTSAPIISVNTLTGVVVLDADDISDASTTNKFATAAEKTKLGFISVTQSVDLDTMESNITTNNAKVSNATHTGDVTGSTALTIANDAVTLAKMADMATASLIYRKTAGTGDPEVNTLATLKTDLLLTGTNSGDQTSIVGITGTKAQFDTAVTDGNFLYVGDVTTNATHTGDVTGATALTIANDAVTYAKMQNVSATDKLLGRSTAGAGDVEEIACTAAGRAILDDADAAAQRATLGLVIGTNVQAYSSVLQNTTASFLTADETKVDFITVTQAVNLDTIESDTATNNAKVTNATHTGEVTGSGALTLDKTAITNRTSVTAAAGDLVLIADISDSNNLKQVTAQSIANLASSGVTDGDKGEIVVSSSGTVWNIDTAATPQVQRIGIGQAASATISHAITIGTSTHVGIDIISAASQSANLLNFRDSASALLSAISKDGYFFKGASRFIHWAGNASFPGAFVGQNSGNTSASGNNNAGLGSSSMSSISSGNDNLGIGSDALRDLSTGSNNTAVGAAANYLNVGASANTAIGKSALASATGGNNVGIGAFAGDNITTGTNNVIIGTSVDAPVATTNGQLSIQNMIFGTGNTATGTTLSTGNIGIGYNDPQARLHIIKTAEQLRVGYDTNNYFNTTVSSAGAVTINAVGASSSFVFSDAVSVPGAAYDATTWNGSLEVPTKNAVRDRFQSMVDGTDFWGGTSTGSANAHAITVSSDITAYVIGQIFRFRAGFTNTGAITINVNALGAVSLNDSFDVALPTNAIVVDSYYEMIYDGSSFRLLSPLSISGTYTPTGTIVGNLDTITMYQAQYIRVGNVVFVSGKFDADATAVSVSTSFRMTLPIASDLTAGQNLGGTAVAWFAGNLSTCAVIEADTTNDAALVEWKIQATNNLAYFYTYGYRIQ